MVDPKAPRFEFTIADVPAGRALTAEEMERLLLQALEKSGGTSKQVLWELARVYSGANRHDEALACLQKIVASTDVREDQASCYLGMGQLHEQLGDFAAAVRYYRTAFSLQPQNTATWYFINNNLGYSLIQLGQFDEAEPYLHAAVAIDPDRANAHKNLGLALLGQGAHAKAAQRFVSATRANAADSRSLGHLEELVARHPEVLDEVRGLGDELDACRKAVAMAASQQPDFEAHWKERRRREN